MHCRIKAIKCLENMLAKLRDYFLTRGKGRKGRMGGSQGGQHGGGGIRFITIEFSLERFLQVRKRT